MGFDSELEDSGSECDIEGQKANIAAHNLRAAAKPVNFVDPTDHLPIFEDMICRVDKIDRFGHGLEVMGGNIGLLPFNVTFRTSVLQFGIAATSSTRLLTYN